MDGDQGILMGKATIIENLGNAQYKVGLIYDRTSIEDKINSINYRIAELQIEIDGMPECPAKEMLKIHKLSLGKTKIQYEAYYNLPNPEYIVYCADFTDDLAGVVGTIELIGEPDKYLQIRPGYNASAVYSADRDGQLSYTFGLTAACDYYNYAMLMGWQKWQPKYRYATITYLDGDLCSIEIEACVNNNIDLNHKTVYNNVTIDYMDTNGEPFRNGDEVLVEMPDWSNPKVVGFKIPHKSIPLVLLKIEFPGDINYVSVWDSVENKLSEFVPLNAGGFATFPCDESLISDWIIANKDIGNQLWTLEEKGFDGAWENYECDPPLGEVCTKTTTNENECRGISGETLTDQIDYQRTKTLTCWGKRYDDYIFWLPNVIQAYLPGPSENFNFDSTEITALNGSGYMGSMIVNLYHLYYKYFLNSYGAILTNYFNSHKYTIKTPIGNFEEIETDSFVFESCGSSEYKSHTYLNPLYADLVGQYSNLLFTQIYWMQYKYSGDLETDRTISVIAQTKVTDGATNPSPQNGFGRDTEFEIAIASLISTWYNANAYDLNEVINCNLSAKLVI